MLFTSIKYEYTSNITLIIRTVMRQKGRDNQVSPISDFSVLHGHMGETIFPSTFVISPGPVPGSNDM